MLAHLFGGCRKGGSQEETFPHEEWVWGENTDPPPTRRRVGGWRRLLPKRRRWAASQGSAEKKSRGPERLDSEEGPLVRRASLQKLRSSEIPVWDSCESGGGVQEHPHPTTPPRPPLPQPLKACWRFLHLVPHRRPHTAILWWKRVR